MRKTVPLNELLKKNKTLLFVALAAVIGLLFFGGLFSSSETDVTRKDISFSESEYIKEQEKKLKVLLQSVSGVGECEVMLTFSEGYEYVYAKDETASSYGENSSYIIVDTSSGDGLAALTFKYPKITGAAIVCSGGGSVTVKNEITDLVSKLYGLSSAQIHVSKYLK